jgi:hypothetical protein
MSGWTKAHQAIKDQFVGKTGVRVVVVEGEDDRDFFEALLNRRSPGWESGWVIGAANGKGNVSTILAAEPTWIGVVDRDEWTQNAANAAAAALGHRLYVLPRFCMESYLIHADELWAALPGTQQSKVTGGLTTFTQAIHSDITSWVRHSALWHAVNPLWDGLRGKGFKEALLDLLTAQDDAAIQNKLREWHDHLEPTRIFLNFTDLLAAATAEPLDIQLAEWMHGKRRFHEHVVPALNRLIGQQSAKDWFTVLTRTLNVPVDLNPLWTAMGL